MPFAYYNRLSARDRAIYQRSDAVTVVALPEAEGLRPRVEELRRPRAGGPPGGRGGGRRARPRPRAEARSAAGRDRHPPRAPVRGVGRAARPLHSRRAPPAADPALDAHGAAPACGGLPHLPDAPHEVGHHLDYELLALPDSFHTEGFFRRESSLFRQLVPEAATRPAGDRRLEPQEGATASYPRPSPATRAGLKSTRASRGS
jgi:hypothetical protein